MWIERVFPAVVAEVSQVRLRLHTEGEALGIRREDIDAIIAGAPACFLDTGCFLDRLANVWRYEYGEPYDLNGKLIWGTHMWVPVRHLVLTLYCALNRLPADKRRDYFTRLADPRRHMIALVEMIPGLRVGRSVSAEFEAEGMGAGNATIDWSFGPVDGRRLLIDVKRRTADYLGQAAATPADATVAPEPSHDPALLFRSLEGKFREANPDTTLQGAWIVTDLQQPENTLQAAFNALDAQRVHFAVLGDWQNDAYVLARRPEDRDFVLRFLRLRDSPRFTFAPTY